MSNQGQLPVGNSPSGWRTPAKTYEEPQARTEPDSSRTQERVSLEELMQQPEPQAPEAPVVDFSDSATDTVFSEAAEEETSPAPKVKTPRPSRRRIKTKADKPKSVASDKAARFNSWEVARKVLPYVIAVEIAALAYVLVAYIHTPAWVLMVGAVVAIWVAYAFGLQRDIKKLQSTTTRPTPTMGSQHLASAALERAGIKYVPLQGQPELIKIEEQRHVGLRRIRQVEVGIFGPKGGVGKSTVATILAWLSASCSQMPTLLADTRQKRGNLAERFGLGRRDDPLEMTPSSTVTIRQAIRLYKDGYFWLASQVMLIVGGIPGIPLWVIASDRSQRVKKFFTFFAEADLRNMLNCMASVFQMIIYEAPDELLREADIEIMRRVDVPIFVHRVNMQNSLEELSDALEQYLVYNNGEFADKIRNHGRLVVLATRKSHSQEEFSRVLGFRPEHVFLIPFSTFFEPALEQTYSPEEFVDLHGSQAVTEPAAEEVQPTQLSKPMGAMFKNKSVAAVQLQQSPSDLPIPTLNLKRMPLDAHLGYMRLLNSGIESLPPTTLTTRPVISSTQPEEGGV